MFQIGIFLCYAHSGGEKMKNKPKKSVSVLIPVELYEKLLKLAKDSNRTLSGYIRQVLRWHVMQVESLHG